MEEEVRLYESMRGHMQDRIERYLKRIKELFDANPSPDRMDDELDSFAREVESENLQGKRLEGGMT